LVQKQLLLISGKSAEAISTSWRQLSVITCLHIAGRFDLIVTWHATYYSLLFSWSPLWNW